METLSLLLIKVGGGGGGGGVTDSSCIGDHAVLELGMACFCYQTQGEHTIKIKLM